MPYRGDIVKARWVSCSQCNGTGSYWLQIGSVIDESRTCEKCNGTGKELEPVDSKERE